LDKGYPVRDEELRPGDTTLVAVSFISPAFIAGRIDARDSLPVFEGPREIGTLEVLVDVWKDPNRLVEPGREYQATVKVLPDAPVIRVVARAPHLAT
jgi:hypothetical protein